MNETDRMTMLRREMDAVRQDGGSVEVWATTDAIKAMVGDTDLAEAFPGDTFNLCAPGPNDDPSVAQLIIAPEGGYEFHDGGLAYPEWMTP